MTNPGERDAALRAAEFMEGAMSGTGSMRPEFEQVEIAPGGVYRDYPKPEAFFALEAKLKTARDALEAAAEKFQRIQWIALPGTMVEARAIDGEEDALSAIAAMDGGS